MAILRFTLAVVALIIGLLLLAPIILVGLPFYLMSISVRFLASRLERSCIKLPDLFEYDSTLGWKAKANLDCYCLEERDDVFHVRTDEYGWAGSESIDDCDVIVFGDSHAFAYGVDHGVSFSQLNRDLRVKAIGVPGYSLVQELLLLERLSPKLGGRMIVWFSYVGNDLHDNLSPEMSGRRAAFVRQNQAKGTWEITTSHINPMPWTCSAGQKTLERIHYPLLPALHSESVFAGRAYSACEALIERGATICRGVGSRLIVMSIPSPFALVPRYVEEARAKYPHLKKIDPDYPDVKLGEICRKLGVQFVALKNYLDGDDYKERHDHWSERGHRRVANVLAELYREHAGSPHRGNGKL